MNAFDPNSNYNIKVVLAVNGDPNSIVQQFEKQVIVREHIGLSYNTGSKCFTMFNKIEANDLGIVEVNVYGNHRNIIGYHFDGGILFDEENDPSYELSPDNIASLKYINVICDAV